MPYSLRTKLKHLAYKCELTEKECERLIKALDTVDAVEKIKAEEAILNKIRAEIEEQVLESLSDGGDDWFAAEKVNECLEIIDKYKAESEDKE